MTRPGDLEAIARVAGAAFAAAEARMAALRAEEARLTRQIADLDGARRDRAARATAEDAALRAGADLRWDRWVETRRRALFSELARLRARIEDARVALARDFGRKSVAEDLTRAAMAEAREARAARAERGW